MNYDSNRDNVDLFFDEMNRPQETVTKGSYFPRSSSVSLFLLVANLDKHDFGREDTSHRL